MGKVIAGHDLNLVYGAGKVGMMGIVANSVLEQGGRVTGVIPRFMAGRELAHESLTELIWVDSMHERKKKMADIADGFVALPGGIGTLEELAEIFTWVQLKLVNKPVGVLNVGGYYDPLLRMLDSMVEQEYLPSSNRSILIEASDPESLVRKMLAAIPPRKEEDHLERT